jgi:hypothetical protein
MRQRMADVDREKYGGPEDFDFADVPPWLDDLGYDGLVALEDEILAEQGKTLLWVLDQILSRTDEAYSLPMVRLRMWLCLRAAGVDLPLAEFKPARPYGVKVDRPAPDAVPPDGESDSLPTSSPESDEATTTSTSESFTDGSTPGQDAATE